MLTHCGTQPIDTCRLLLRPFAYSDDSDMLANWAGDAHVQPMYGEPVYSTLGEVRQLLDKYIGAYANEDYYRWAAIEKSSGKCIGQIAFFLVDSKNHFAEIEYCIGRGFQRKGYASEATKAVIHYGFRHIHLHKIQICHRPTNLASKGVIEKCGFVYEGTLRDYFFRNGAYESRMYYSLLEEEWEARQ